MIDISSVVFAGHPTEPAEPCDGTRWNHLIEAPDSCRLTADTNTDQQNIWDELYRRLDPSKHQNRLVLGYTRPVQMKMNNPVFPQEIFFFFSFSGCAEFMPLTACTKCVDLL